MSGRGRQVLPNVREWSGGPLGLTIVVGKTSRVIGRPSRMFGSGRRNSRMSESGRESLPDVREWSEDTPR